MLEERSRPTSFAEAQAKTKMGEIEDASSIESWYSNFNENLQDATDAAAQETEDKGFWGNLLTIGTTVGCMLLDPTKGMLCAAAGVAAGTGARIAVDITGDAEKQVPGEATGPDVDYYRNKIPDLVKNLNSSKETLDNYHANEWKKDVLLQLNDTWTAVRIGSGLNEMGLFTLGEEAGEAATQIALNEESPLFDSNLLAGYEEQFGEYLHTEIDTPWGKQWMMSGEWVTEDVYKEAI